MLYLFFGKNKCFHYLVLLLKFYYASLFTDDYPGGKAVKDCWQLYLFLTFCVKMRKEQSALVEKEAAVEKRFKITSRHTGNTNSSNLALFLDLSDSEIYFFLL